MFETLIESGMHGARRGLAPSRVVSLLAHVALGAAAAWATLPPKSVARAEPPPIVIRWPDAAEPDPPLPPQPIPGPPGVVVRVPIEPPVGLPPVAPGVPFDPTLWLRAGSDTAGGSTAAADSAAPWRATLVDEQPVLLTGPRLGYPESLRRAGIAGRVVVQVVVDTLGRAEPSTVAVFDSPNPGFDSSARHYVLRALFRPARVRGRAVRVLVRVPIEFMLRPGH